MAHDRLLAIGEALIDFIPAETDCPFQTVSSFAPMIGGAPANVCGAFAKLGGKASLITQLGNDPFGDKILADLRAADVDTDCIARTAQANTALAFVSLSAEGARTFSFYRNPSADMLFKPQQIRSEWFLDAFALHFCSVSLGDFPMREAHQTAILHASVAGSIISFDPNLRLPLWESEQAMVDAVADFLPQADLLKLSDEELPVLTGTHELEKALPKLLIGRVKLVVLTCGKRGAFACTADTQVFASAASVPATDTTGAGDGFIGAFLWKLLQLGCTAAMLPTLPQPQLLECLQFANAFCAASVQAAGAIASYPTLAQLQAQLRKDENE